MAHLGTPWQLSPARTRARARARTRTSTTRPGVGSAGYGTHRECRLAAAGCCCRGPSAVCCSRSRVSTLSALTPTLSSPENVLRRLRLQPVVLASGSSRAAALFSFSSCRGEKATLKRSYRSDRASHDSPMAALRVQGCHRPRRTGCGSGGTSAPRGYSSTKRTAPSARKSKGRSWRKSKAVSAMHTIYIQTAHTHFAHTRRGAPRVRALQAPAAPSSRCWEARAQREVVAEHGPGRPPAPHAPPSLHSIEPCFCSKKREGAGGFRGPLPLLSWGETEAART